MPLPNLKKALENHRLGYPAHMKWRLLKEGKFFQQQHKRAEDVDVASTIVSFELMCILFQRACRAAQLSSDDVTMYTHATSETYDIIHGFLEDQIDNPLSPVSPEILSLRLIQEQPVLVDGLKKALGVYTEKQPSREYIKELVETCSRYEKLEHERNMARSLDFRAKLSEALSKIGTAESGEDSDEDDDYKPMRQSF